MTVDVSASGAKGKTNLTCPSPRAEPASLRSSWKLCVQHSVEALPAGETVGWGLGSAPHPPPDCTFSRRDWSGSSFGPH